MDTVKPLDQQTLQELKQTAANEGVQGADVFDKKIQVITLIKGLRVAKGLPEDVEPNAPVAPEAPAERVNPEEFAGQQNSVDPEAVDPAIEAAANAPTPTEPVDPMASAPADLPSSDSTQPVEVAQPPVEPPLPKKIDNNNDDAGPSEPVSVAPVSPVEEKKDEVAWKSENARVAEMLRTRPTVKIIVPLDLFEKPGSYFPVIFNGYRVDVLKNHYVDLPDVLAEIVTESFNQSAKVGEEIAIDRIDPTTGQTYAASMGLRG